MLTWFHFRRYASTQPPTKNFLARLDAEERLRAEQALGAAASCALKEGAIQVASAVVVAKHPETDASAL
eukprot:SAG31_NODE_8379_length_1463_cov_1.503666_2_plen_69_part_00